MQIVAIKCRDHGWLIAPLNWFEDEGTHFRLRLWVFDRLVYKSSIDREYRLSWFHGLLALPVLVTYWLLFFLAQLSWKLCLAFLRF